MERKSKEEIVNEGLAIFQKKYPGLRWIDDIESNKEMHEFSQYILSAFADQEMALFAEWIRKEGYDFRGGMWMDQMCDYPFLSKEQEENTPTYTTQQLLTIYKEQNGRKEDT